MWFWLPMQGCGKMMYDWPSGIVLRMSFISELIHNGDPIILESCLNLAVFSQ